MSTREGSSRKRRDPAWGEWSPWEWDFVEKCFVRERWNAQGERNVQKGERAAANEPRTMTDTTQQLRNLRLDVDYTTGVDYRLQQGFHADASAQEGIGGAESSSSQPHPLQVGSFPNVNVRPRPYSVISDPAASTVGSMGRGYPIPAPTATYYNPASIGSVSDQMNNLGLSAQPTDRSTPGSEFHPGSYSSPSHSYQARSDMAEDREISGGSDADAADEGDDDDQIEQDDQGEQYFNESNELDDELDDAEADSQNRTTDQSVRGSSKQPKKISKDDIFTTKDPQIRKQSLYKEFKVHHSREFKKGRVFKILWPEPFGAVGRNGSSGTDPIYIKETHYGEKVYTTIRRFVVVKTRKGHCMCLPILTYGKQGTAKSGVKAEDHTIIYTSNQPPDLLPGEPSLYKTPIKMIPESKRVKLEPQSRVNYNKLYTVEHNVKVSFIGKIALDSERQFFADFKRTFDRDDDS